MNEAQLWWNSQELPHVKYMEALQVKYKNWITYAHMYMWLYVLSHSICEY